MAVTQTITIRKENEIFYTVNEAVDLFMLECETPALLSNEKFNNDAIDAGEMVETKSLTLAEDGVITTRTWTDTKWLDAEATKHTRKSEKQYNNGWIRTATVS
jgi:hypothetical protein